MIAQQGSWLDVRIGSYISDKAGVAWKVTYERDGRLLLVNAAGAKLAVERPDPFSPVTLFVPSHDEAVALVGTALGGDEIGTTEGESTGWKCPPFPSTKSAANLAHARSHMHILHGIWVGDVKTIGGMVEAHDSSHDHPNPPYYVNHTHRGA